MKIVEVDIPAGVLGYSVNDENVIIEYFRGRGVKVIVPEKIDERLVTEIKKKAFFGAKSLVKIDLPLSISKIGEWSFASCNSLEEIEIPNIDAQLGTSLFKNCDKLRKIYSSKETTNVRAKENKAIDEQAIEKTIAPREQIASLFALAASMEGAGHLIDLKRAGSDEWISELDHLLTLMIAKDDEEGFSQMLLCGEEDYVGDDSNLEVYKSLRKKDKLKKIFIRLLNSYKLEESVERLFAAYLKESMPGETWQLVLDEHGDEQEYFDLLLRCECINPNNIDTLIENMGEKYPGMKAYLIRKKSEMGGENDFFAELDF